MSSTVATPEQKIQPGSSMSPSSETRALPKLGFLGTGWIGRHRMEAIVRSGLAEVIAIADPLDTNTAQAAKIAPTAAQVRALDEMLDLGVDGVVIATPSALHAQQAIAALESGAAVFCQKPLARTRAETKGVIDVAARCDRLLGVDLSYRFTSGMQAIRGLIQGGELGRIFAADLVFHNAYGPDKAWFYDPKLSGGGCVIDLGIHLVDLLFWILNEQTVSGVSSRLYAGGQLLGRRGETVEDFATARIDLDDGVSAQLSCSWKLQAGCDAVISATFYGTEGGVQFRNVNGSFYDFQAERFHGTRRELLAGGSEEWGGRAAVDWVKRLAEGENFDAGIERLIDVAATLDKIYQRE